MVVQALVLKPAVVALDVGVLVRVGWIELPQVYIALVHPVEHCLSNELRSFVTANDSRYSPPNRQLIEMARQLRSTHTVIWYGRIGFVGRIVNYG